MVVCIRMSFGRISDIRRESMLYIVFNFSFIKRVPRTLDFVNCTIEESEFVHVLNGYRGAVIGYRITVIVERLAVIGGSGNERGLTHVARPAVT